MRKRSFLQNISKGKYDSREIDLKRGFFKLVNQRMVVKNVESGLKYISEIATYFIQTEEKSASRLPNNMFSYGDGLINGNPACYRSAEVSKNNCSISVCDTTSISLSLKKAEALFTRRDHTATKKKIDREVKSENGTIDYKRKLLQFSTVHIMQR